MNKPLKLDAQMTEVTQRNALLVETLETDMATSNALGAVLETLRGYQEKANIEIENVYGYAVMVKFTFRGTMPDVEDDGPFLIEDEVEDNIPTEPPLAIETLKQSVTDCRETSSQFIATQNDPVEAEAQLEAEAPKAEDPAPAELKRGPYTEDEDIAVLDLTDEGLSVKEIGAKLNRHPSGVASRLRLLQKVAAADRAEEEEIETAPQLPPAKPTKPTAGSYQMPETGSITLAEAKLHYEALEPDPNWTVKDDFILLGRHCRGESMGNIANDLSKTKQEAVNRFRKIMPNTSNPHNPGKLYAVLKAMPEAL
ncbi:helix-turn-helix domain-containing protein [Marivivens aquimaris]|uniref:helix-turn-helix domain-containing protein n=1 Tax=Marivivens aquimaris TaxID=2774876 RepID=UPI00187F6336|nr:helix-turn-helix domain-containing protein [Marivivens aquimaris]